MTTIRRILLVDDNEADNVFHEIMLRRAGYTGSMAVCESGQAALDYLRGCGDRFPELILVDINMPGMDGFTFVERSAALLQSSRTSLIMLTSSNAHNDIERARTQPLITGYIVKPLTADTAIQLLQGNYTARP